MNGLRQNGPGRGQGLVEFAIVFPIFLLVLFGLFDIGRAVFSYNEITNAAREGARLAIVNQDPGALDDRIASQTSGVGTSHCVYFLKADATFNSCNQGSTSPSGSDLCGSLAVGCIVHVEVWTDYSSITPVLGTFIGQVTLTANSESAVEFVCPNADIPEWSSSAQCPKQP
jgi:hypothetical protein